MTNSAMPAKGCDGFLDASHHFWVCNIAGWLTFGFAQAFVNSFAGDTYKAELQSTLPVALLGICCGYSTHYLLKKGRWMDRHPLELVPYAACISIVFGMIAVSISRFDLAFDIPVICARNTPRPPYSCGALSDLFLQSMGAMLVWCLLFFLIRADRHGNEKRRPDLITIGAALLVLVLLNHLGIFLSVIAYVDWGETRYLFSRAYGFDALMNLIPFASAAYIVCVRSEIVVFRSRTLPLVPLMVMMAFFCTALNVEVAGAIDRLATFGTERDLRFILFGPSYGRYSGPGQLAGVIEGGMINSLCMTLFFFSCRNTCGLHVRADGSETIRFHNLSPVWVYSLLFWLLFSFLLYGIDLMELSSFGRSVPLVSAVSCIVIGMFLGVLIRLQVVYFIKQSASSLYLTLTISIVSAFAGILMTYAMWLVNYGYIVLAMEGQEIDLFANFVNSENYIISSFLSSAVLCGLWAFKCLMTESLVMHREAAFKQLQLERNIKDLQLNALAGRVDPHFIFNALNNIRALVGENGEKARSAIAALSDILRGPITSSSRNTITLAEEMLLVRNYISLAKIQYEERLNYREEFEEEVRFALIPSMMLQIMVENAIKHGISQLVGGGDLVLVVRKSDQDLWCEVRNTGLLNPESGTGGFGVGTRAIRERLSLLYGSRGRFRLYEACSQVIAELILPFERLV